MKVYYLYKITNTVTGEYYFGYHGTSRLDDGYMGSGVNIKKSIEKYGESAHFKEILEYFETDVQARIAEYAMVTEEMIADPLCLNMVPGGGSEMDRKLIEQMMKL